MGQVLIGLAIGLTLYFSPDAVIRENVETRTVNNVRHRHDVRPGLTGYAQAHGRNALSWEDKFAMDVWYTRHISFICDLRILCDTILSVIKRDGISSEGSVTTEEFKGTPPGVKATWRAPH